jgi:kynurenine formamidase
MARTRSIETDWRQSVDRIQQLTDLLRSMTAVDLAPRLERGMPKYPAHPHLVIDPTVTHARNGYYCQTLSMPEHVGCHVDAPAHTVPNMMHATVDTLAADQLFGPAVLYNFADRDWQPGQTLSADEIRAYEKEHKIEAGPGDMVLVNFGWHRRHWTKPGFYERNQPGMDESVTVLFADRRVRAVGADTIACEIPLVKGVPGDSPGHRRHWLPNGILIVECLAQLEQLPLRSFIVASPLPIQNGSGSPLRPVAYF